MQRNVNLPGQAIIGSLFYLSFQREKCEYRVIIALIKPDKYCYHTLYTFQF